MSRKEVLKIILTFFLIGFISSGIFNVVHSKLKLRNSVTEYSVIDKNYRSSYSTTFMTYIGKSLVPINQYHPEEWSINCQGLDSRNNVQDFKFYVSEEKYNDTNIGDVIYKQ